MQAVGQEGHEDVGLDARFGFVEDRPDGQVVLDLLEGLLDFGELDVELKLQVAHGDGSFARRLAQRARLDLLVIDDFAISPIGAAERNDLLELLDDRIGARSTLITSQLPVKAWHTCLNDPTLADAYAANSMRSALPRLILFIGDVCTTITDAITALGNTMHRFVAGRSSPRPNHHVKPHPSCAYKG